MVAVRFLPEAFLRPSHSLITGICPGINGNAAKGLGNQTHFSAREKTGYSWPGHACRKSYNFQSTGNSTWPPFLSS